MAASSKFHCTAGLREEATAAQQQQQAADSRAVDEAPKQDKTRWLWI
jgi:hypothetical protein